MLPLLRAHDVAGPGTLGVCRSVLLAAGGYSGEVLFENPEMARTIRAAGRCEAVPPDLVAARARSFSIQVKDYPVFSDYKAGASVRSESHARKSAVRVFSFGSVSRGVLSDVIVNVDLPRIGTDQRSVRPGAGPLPNNTTQPLYNCLVINSFAHLAHLRGDFLDVSVVHCCPVKIDPDGPPLRLAGH